MGRGTARVGMAAVVLAATGAVGAILATAVLPWSLFAGNFGLTRFPGWGWYAAAAAALNVVTASALWRPGRPPKPAVAAAIGLCVATIGTAVALMSQYDDGHALHGPIVPMVKPALGPGGPVAVLAALASAAAVVVHYRNNRITARPAP